MRYSHMLTVPLSTMDQNAADIGVKAAQRLIECMAVEQPLRPKTIFVPSKLIARASSVRRS